MKRIDVLIPEAINAITHHRIPDKSSRIVPNEYKGYIDTFGASIVQNGLIPAIIFFETAEGKKGESISNDPEKQGIFKNRNKLMKAILQVVLHSDTEPLTPPPDTLYKYVTAKTSGGKTEKQIRQQVVDAAIAIKLALRTFTIAKTSENEPAEI